MLTVSPESLILNVPLASVGLPIDSVPLPFVMIDSPLAPSLVG